MIKKAMNTAMENVNFQIENLTALQNIKKYTDTGKHLASTRSSLNYFTISSIINDILINKRSNIIEFGSGISSIIIARFIKIENISAKLYSIEGNEGWFNYLESIIKEENLEDYITLIYAPLTKCSISKNNLEWYDIEKIEKGINNMTFDTVIIDGPEAYEKHIEMARYPALIYIYEKLNIRYSIFLDDSTRNGEKKIRALWENKLNIKFKLINKNLSIAIKGDCYNII